MNMDNIIFKSIWYDEVADFFEVNLKAQNQYACISQSCYFSDETIIEFQDALNDYLQKPTIEKLITIGNFEGNSTPAFSMKLFPCKLDGAVVVEMDMEIEDSIERNHRCQFYVSTTLYYLENLKKSVVNLSKKYNFEEISLHVLD